MRNINIEGEGGCTNRIIPKIHNYRDWKMIGLGKLLQDTCTPPAWVTESYIIPDGINPIQSGLNSLNPSSSIGPRK